MTIIPSSAADERRRLEAIEERRKIEAIGFGVALPWAIYGIALWPWLLAPAALLLLFVMAISRNRVASTIGRWAWRAIGVGLYVLASLWLVHLFAR